VAVSRLSARAVRELATFLLGAGGFAHELLVAPTERPFIISASLALMGLPFVLRGEDKLREGEETER
jgi:hypothetical protein